jgi:hypothetical protein
MTDQMLKNKHVKLSIEIILFYKTTLSAMKKWPHNRGGLSHDGDNFVAFGFILRHLIKSEKLPLTLPPENISLIRLNFKWTTIVKYYQIDKTN